ncbi:MAG TPA: dUTPase [Firmicutes bacterium]|nr:dUTPase [Bacillota bacterium]
MDKLERVFELQRQLDDMIQERWKIAFDQSTWVQKETLAMIDELMELLNLTGFKWWKKSPAMDRNKIVEELTDVFHFFISTCLKLEIGPEELFEAYVRKNRENRLRQLGLSTKDGYVASTAEKNPGSSCYERDADELERRKGDRLQS